MNNFARAHDSYLNPPDEPEAELCEHCNVEMEEIKYPDGSRDMKCLNSFCPDKHEGVAKEMAELLIGAQEEVKSLARKIRRLEGSR